MAQNNKTLNLTIVGDQSSTTTKTYLTYFKENGVIPKRLILVDFMRTNPNNKLLKKLGYFGNFAYKKKVHIPSKIYHEDFIEASKAIQEKFPIKVNLFNEFNFDKYADSVIKIKALDFSDYDLLRLISKYKQEIFLYTDGGIIPSIMFEECGLKIIHAHPGIIPFVKGTDGLFWSILTREKIGVSCFFMNAGIDTGDLLNQEEFDIVKYPPLEKASDCDMSLWAEVLNQVYDPHFRALLLIKTFNQVDYDLSRLKVQPKEEHEVAHYHSMHQKLKEMVMKNKIFIESKPI